MGNIRERKVEDIRERKTEGLSLQRFRLSLELLLDDENLVNQVESLCQQYNEHLRFELDKIWKKHKDKRTATKKVISGALISAIKDHGPITMKFVPSATKRVESNILHNGKPIKGDEDG